MAETKRNFLLKKDFEKIRDRMRAYYLYGYSTLIYEEESSDSTRKNETQRIRYWMDQQLKKGRKKQERSVFDDAMSFDVHSKRHNPFFKAWKSKAFDTNAIHFHFFLFDTLNDPKVKSAGVPTVEIIKKIKDKSSCGFFDDTRTAQYYLSRYKQRGMIDSISKVQQNLQSGGQRSVSKPHYYIPEQPKLDQSHYDAISFFSEVSPCGVIGSFVLDRLKAQKDIFLFKHHFITNTLDSDVLLSLLNAIHEKQSISVFNHNRKGAVTNRIQLVPLKIYMSVQNGRQYVLAYQKNFGNIRAFRLDFLSHIKMEGRFKNYDDLTKQFNEKKDKIWGVNIIETPDGQESLETVEMILKIEKDEPYILERLKRENRCGVLTEEDAENGLYRYFAQVYDTKEMIPWIRTLLCRIVKIKFSNADLQKEFETNLQKMYDMYGIGNEDNI